MSEDTKALSRGSTIQLWLAVIIAITLGGWIVKDQVWKTRIEMRLANIEDSVGDRWTKSQMRLWVAEFEKVNPSIKIPDPSTISYIKD